MREQVRLLAKTRERPFMALGSRDAGHLRAIYAPLRLLWEKQIVERPLHAHLQVSPTQFVLRCYAGPLVRRLDELVPWQNCDTLVDGLFDASYRLADLRWEGRDDPVHWTRQYNDSTLPLGAPTSAFLLADRGVFGVRLQQGFWYQTFRQGWPVCPPLWLDDTGGVGLLSVAALSPQWFVGLPFTPEAIRAVIPEAARHFVDLEWHDEDDLVPECPSDPSCVLDPRNIHRWL